MAIEDIDKRRAFALQLLNNPLLGDILEGMKTSVFNQWKSAGDPAARDALWHRYNSVEWVQKAIESELSKADEALGLGNTDEEDSL